MSEHVYAKAKTGTYIGRKTDKGSMEFVGIRYAQAPQRWKAAEKLPKSELLIRALDYGPIPMQVFDPSEYQDGVPFMSEDCLTLNIFTSSLETKKPVYVFIHGGSFLIGAAHEQTFAGVYNGDRFVVAHPDIVYINITYRVSAFGSMDLRAVDPEGEYADSVNLNVLDQLRALEWIYENVEAFGGDPEHITIGGQSAGSYSVASLLMMPEARKYFKAAILESSAPTDSEMKTMDIAAEAARIFRDLSGAHTLKELLALTPSEVAKYGEDMFYEGPRGAYGTTRDGRILPLMPEAALEEAAKSGIVIMSGTNDGEYDTMMTCMDNDCIKTMIKRRNPICTDEVIQAVISNYPERDERTALMDMHNDCGMRVRQILTTEDYVRGGGKVFYYYMKHHPGTNYVRCQHCTELACVSQKPYAHATLEPLEKEQWLLGKEPDMGFFGLINSVWCNFIRNYDPNGEGVGICWKPYTLEEKYTANLGDKGFAELTGEVRRKDMDIVRKLHKNIVLEAEVRH